MAQTSGYKVVLASALVLAIAVSLWFAAPVFSTAGAYNYQGFAQNNEGEYDKAIVTFTKAIELDPDFALAYNNRAWAYLELGEYEKALADCNRAIELNPVLAQAYSNRA